MNGTHLDELVAHALACNALWRERRRNGYAMCGIRRRTGLRTIERHSSEAATATCL